jgi:hypothetical protein
VSRESKEVISKFTVPDRKKGMQMSTARDQLKHSLKDLARLPPGSPSDQEFDLVLAEIRQIAQKRKPHDQDWLNAAFRHVRGARIIETIGEDMSNLNALLVQIMNQGGQSGPPVVKK